MDMSQEGTARERATNVYLPWGRHQPCPGRLQREAFHPMVAAGPASYVS